MNWKTLKGHPWWRQQLLLAVGISVTLMLLAIIRMASVGSGD